MGLFSGSLRLLFVSVLGVFVVVGSLATSLVVAPPAGAATTLFVSATGSDTNPCAAAAPCATITHALTLSASGDTIEVAGTISDGGIGGASGISNTLTVEQWPGQAPAVVDGAAHANSVFIVSATGNLTLLGVTVTGGSATNGGGIDSISGGTVTIIDSTVTNNVATVDGGGIVSEGDLTVKDSTISHNMATGFVPAGGGMNLGGTTTTITDSTISDNTADGFDALGGGLVLNGSTANITDSTIAGNAVEGSPVNGAGGISNSDDLLTLTATTITDNSTAEGGFGPGGLSSGGGLTTGATIVAGNTGTGAFGGTSNCNISSNTSKGYNLTDDATGAACGFTQPSDKFNVNPDLGPLANNGGPTQTLLPGPTSPPVGVIPSPTTLNTVPVCGPGAFDQRGVPRPSPGPSCTVGAVEAAPGTAPVITSANSTVFTAGTNGSFTVTTSGLPTPALSVSTGPGQTGLPQGVGFSDNGNGTATVSGTAAGPGVDTFTITASNGSAPAATQDFTLVVQDSLSGGAAMTALPNGTGYWIVHPDGGVFSYGAAPFLGSLPGIGIHVNDIVGVATTPDGKGYWLVGSDGGVFSFGDAAFFGSMGGKPLNQPVVAIAATPDGGGYFMVASDGGVFSFGDATFAGSMGGTALNKPMVALTADPAGGYWLVASDGGVFSFGGAPFLGSMGGTPLVQPVVGVTAAPGGTGYWLVAKDGGVFAFGHAPFAGSLGGSALSIIGLFSTNAGTGYTLVEANGTAHAF